MDRNERLQKAVKIAYITVSLALIVFTVYLCFAEHNVVYQARRDESYEVFEDYTETIIEDAGAPAGIRRKFCWRLNDISTTKDNVAFYIVHHYAQVYIDNELVYSLQPSQNNRIGGTPGSNWVFVPLDQRDSGKEITIVLTPVYKTIRDLEVEFLLGSRADIVLDCLEADLPQIVMAVLCVFIGAALMLTPPICALFKKPTSWGIFYLGNLLLAVGIWRITDVRFSGIFLPGQTMALGYITLEALLIGAVPLLLFIKELFSGRKKKVLLFTALIVCLNAMITLILQVFGIAELRETLIFCHAMLLLCVIVMFLVSMFHKDEEPAEKGLQMLTTMISVGGLLDLATYYLSEDSRSLIFTVLALMIYTVQRTISELRTINKKVYTDVQTGLYNRNRWNELMKKPTPMDPDTAVMMFDLNRLKAVNDTMGHRAGDKMILGFVRILKENLPEECTIYRWGGDEFTALVQEADTQKLEVCIAKIREKAEEYNQSGQTPQIYFAVGYALASDYPGFSCEELMKKADEKMYYNKSAWYRKNAGGGTCKEEEKEPVRHDFA